MIWKKDCLSIQCEAKQHHYSILKANLFNITKQAK